MNLFLIYLWTCLDSLNGLIIGISITSFIGIIIWLVVTMIIYSDIYENDKEEFNLTSRLKKIKRYALIPLFGFILEVFIPSQKDVAIIAGAWVTNAAIENPKVQEIAIKTYDLINSKLDEALKDSKDHK